MRSACTASSGCVRDRRRALVQPLVRDIGSVVPEARRSGRQQSRLDRLLERRRDLLASARFRKAHHLAPHELVCVRWLKARALQELSERPPGGWVFVFPGAQQLMGLVRAATSA